MDRRSFLTAAAGGLAAPLVMQHAALGADPITVVGIHDASGGLDIYGKPMVATLDFAVDEINAAGGLLGRPIKLINYDPQSNIQLYTQFATQAATKDKAAVVHGGITSASREAIRPVLKRYNTLYFYNTQYEGGVCDRNCFCAGSTPAQNVQRLVPYIMNKWGKKAYILAADYNYGQITSKWVTKFFREGGGDSVAVDFFPLDVTNFGPAIQKIQSAKPDIVVSVLVGGAHVSFYRQWAAAGMKSRIPMASTTFGGGNESLLLSQEEGDGITCAFSYFQEVETPANASFLQKFKAKFGANTPYLGGELAMRSYVGMHLWAEGVRRAKSVDRMKVIEALESGVSFDGPPGKTVLDPKTNHVTLDVYVAEVQNKGFKVLQHFPNSPPADTQSVCDLQKEPNANKQVVVDVKI
ncbi:urea ABC transporter substrate-binding protein [Paracraurococcus lichenis]|uniref:Transporter substrate-binding protein n=1 Tax=Paracraurococcus lichenis TaxID=3064888 RepID=A0ABT9E6L0_9PROT|nr:ABC transporter substrate-binding protein [Paracraurococcus sp. LOR1-02]MDO9711814.1 transporter substrate-binding protein [Paracraurococcus sp. LOR1-02]